MSSVTPVGAPPGSRRNGPALLAGVPRRGMSRRLLLGGAVVLIVAILAITRLVAPSAAPTPTPTGVSAQARLVAHGTIAPVSQARVGTLAGGVLTEISVAIGQSVSAQQEIARVRGAAGATEQLTAPFAGTVTGVLAHTGDTLVPGAGVLLIADLSRLQVETTDVDEFLVSRVRPGQPVALRIDALEGRELTGRVLTVALQPQTTPAGDQHYPVTIDLGGATPDLRPGMSVRITLPD
jgi:multidrug efflux pump subunit AcrA (membrane-fusion protein)